MIKVATDYHAGLPADIVEQYGIVRLSSYISFGGKEREEGPDYTPDDFYRELEASPHFPQTRPRTVDEFAVTFEQLLAESGVSAVLYVAFSAQMSAMYVNAVEAATRFPSGAVTVFDTRTVAIAEALMVRQAAVMAADGADVKAILPALEPIRDLGRTFFVLDTLDYLAKGGRIGRAAGLVGKVISTKPVLTIVNGEVTSYARFNQRASALNNLSDLLRSVAEDNEGVQVGIAHAACYDEAKTLLAAFEEEFHPAVSFIGDVSPAVGAHAGPGALSLGWYVPAS